MNSETYLPWKLYYSLVSYKRQIRFPCIFIFRIFYDLFNIQQTYLHEYVVFVHELRTNKTPFSLSFSHTFYIFLFYIHSESWHDDYDVDLWKTRPSIFASTSTSWNSISSNLCMSPRRGFPNSEKVWAMSGLIKRVRQVADLTVIVIKARTLTSLPAAILLRQPANGKHAPQTTAALGTNFKDKTWLMHIIGTLMSSLIQFVYSS